MAVSIERLRKANTSKKAAGTSIYRYLLRNLAIERSNQVWAADIIYIPMRRSFVYLVDVVDWFSKKVLARRVTGNRRAPLIPTEILSDQRRPPLHTLSQI